MRIPAAVATAAAPTTAAATLARLRLRARPVILSVTLVVTLPASAAAWTRTRATFFRACLTAGFLASCVASSSPLRLVCEITVLARPTTCAVVSFAFAIFVVPPCRVIFSSFHKDAGARMSRGSTATEWLRRRGFHVEAWVSRPLLAIGICAPLGLSHGALRQPGARTLLSNVYTDAKGEAMNSPWRLAAPPANARNPNRACKLWGLVPLIQSSRATGFGATSSAVGCMLALPTLAEKSPEQRTAPPGPLSDQLVDAPLSSTALSSQLAEQPRRVAQTVIKNSAGQIE